MADSNTSLFIMVVPAACAATNSSYHGSFLVLLLAIAPAMLWGTAAVPVVCHAFTPTGILSTPRAASTTTSSLAAVWSDMKAVQDYKDFLASGKQELEMAADGPSVIITSLSSSSSPDQVLPLAAALVTMGLGQDMVLTPDQELPDTLGGFEHYPIYVALPPTQLAAFLDKLRDNDTAATRKTDDFVFFSGGLEYGNIEDVLKVRGYCRDTMTQVLISGLRVLNGGRVEDMSVRLDTESAVGDAKYAGECAACGKWAGAVVERLGRNGVRCRADFYREWRRQMWERSAYDAVFHVMGVVRSQPTTVQQVALYYSTDVSDAVWEMSQLLRGWKALTLLYGFEERMFGVAERVGRDQATMLVEEMYPFIWGNPLFLQSKTFVDYLGYAQEEMGLLKGIELPRKPDEEYVSKMRQGNLRADGVV
jgi:hypothetical protein